jgi:hypothetical protein
LSQSAINNAIEKPHAAIISETIVRAIWNIVILKKQVKPQEKDASW